VGAFFSTSGVVENTHSMLKTPRCLSGPLSGTVSFKMACGAPDYIPRIIVEVPKREQEFVGSRASWVWERNLGGEMR